MVQINVSDILVPMARVLGLTDTELMQVARQNILDTDPDNMQLLPTLYGKYRELAEAVVNGTEDEKRPAVSVAMELLYAAIFAEQGLLLELLDTLEDAILQAQNYIGTSHDHPEFPKVVSTCKAIISGLDI